MKFVCDAGTKTWFRIETAGEAALESQVMQHTVERYFRDAYDEMARRHKPDASLSRIESSIGRDAFVQRTMPMFLTLRDAEGTALVTAMLPPAGGNETSFRPIVVGPSNGDPYLAHGDAIKTLAAHFGLKLDPVRCYPYRRK